MADHLLEVRNLSVDFHTAAGTVSAVRNVSWHLDRGETLAILGESGSGKSVSASTIMNLIDMPPGEIKSGEVLFEGRDLLKMTDEQRRSLNGKRIAMIFQDPLSHLNPVYTVGWQICEIMRVHDVPADKARARTLELLKRVGITDPEAAMGKYPHEFSGGQRQRLMIAMALALKPDILIADEPTTALDVTVQAQVLALLEELQQETGMGLLLITHDLGVVAEIADRVVVMNRGEVVESGEAAEVYRNPKHPYTKRLIDAAPGKGETREEGDRKGEPLLRVERLQQHYGGFQALKGASFTIMPGETVAIVGESGSGKSTMARAILRLDEPSGGKVIWKGRDLLQMSPKEIFAIRRDIQMVFQDPTQSLNPRMTVYQIISEAWVVHPEILPKARWKERVAELLVQVGLQPDMARRYPHQFSGGQRQRIAIARALALEPKLIICDEAVSALDVSIQAQVIELLDGLRRDLGLSYLFIAHDLPVVRDFADRVIVMKSGEIVEEGPTGQIFDHPLQPYTRALLAASLDPDPEVQAARRAIRLSEGLVPA
ncbi:ABC transporter ATP-binding protein [Paracoccus litorisediminis]|jgi:peptide/nickel transport system ATP-binding protein|uniref:Dipeptide ABC transporter ATP-binding protein n=1 Tax=Paracoccus litorisediminis TaxID=2006130 RepID=A0A844HJ64_9RHOB|nr:ABC transporter ATP-binding protein [Paracoccus litorisediminis]MTH60203.1 dipeptide ABC transporter ATP-binding protein [Paracoccus litorisediminis]